jgi:two component, sigma54 specific, transcriptional regulator, Fis family
MKIPGDEMAIAKPASKRVPIRKIGTDFPIDQIDDQLLFENSDKMRSIGEIINRIADTDVPVLISGESGTGKELAANAIHAHSLRENKSMVKVNCVALPGSLLESELFGYEKGAFTGAYQSKPGRFEFANEGTIFLDEIGDMFQPSQAKLLRVLQEGEFSRLGGNREIKVDVRVISATNCNIEKMVAEGGFREDLFHRLNVVRIHIPPLRERKKEISGLVRYFMKKYSREYDRKLKKLTERGLNLLLAYDWPGNIRELENTIKEIVVLEDEETVLQSLIDSQDREKAFAIDRRIYDGDLSLKEIGKMAALDAEKKIIKRVLDQTRWNRSQAAEILKVSYKTLLYKIKESGLDRRV